MIKILILGSTGMAGHVIYKYFESLNKFDLYNISYRKKLNESSITLDVSNSDLLEHRIIEINPDIIINSIGVLIKGSASNPANAIFINSFLPHNLVGIADKINSKVIHLSTDCVFSGKKGRYLENDFRDADDIYGRSKALGEIDYGKHLTIRTSIIGPELKIDGEGLMHWFFTQRGEVNGFSEAIWSGVTTLELAKSLISFIENNISGVYHLTNNKEISKYDLLCMIKKIWAINHIKINKINGKRINKSFLDTRNEIDYKVHDYLESLSELKEFFDKNLENYLHYNLVKI